MKNAVIYLRVSTGKQAEKELPIESQRDQCEKKAASLNASVVKVFADEGVSGRSDSRPDFQSALAYCELNDIDFFVCWSTSRFARNRLDAQLNKRRLLSVGTKVEYVTVNIEDSGSGVLHEGILELFDEYLSHQVSADTRRSMMKNARDGYWNGGTPAFGYKVGICAENTKKKKLYPDEVESILVNDIFKMRLGGLGGKSIADKLNKSNKLNRGKKWNKTSIASLLRNERLIGKSIFGQRINNINQPRDRWIIVDAHSPIVDSTLFESVQKIMNESRPQHSDSSPKSTWHFTGLLSCAECDGTMQIESAKGRNQRYYYYNCRNAQKGHGCRNRRLRADILDAWLDSVIAEKVFTTDNLRNLMSDVNEMYSKWAVDNKSRRVSIVTELTNLKNRNAKLYSLLESPDVTLNIEDLSPRLRDNNSEIKRLERDLHSIDVDKPPSIHFDESYLSDVIEFLTQKIQSDDNPASVRRFYSSFIDSVVVNKKSVTINYNSDALVLAHTEELVPSELNWLRLLGSNQRPND